MNENDPFPWDRVFPSHDELSMFGDELAEFCADVADDRATLVSENERLQAQIRAMQV